MITQYFDVNARLVIQAPGTLAPASSTNWVYGDNYNLAVYLVSQGIFQQIATGDTLGLMLFSPGGSLPEDNLAIISVPQVLTDAAGYQYFSVNVNLKTTGLADLVQTPNAPAKTNFHYTFSPADGERFSSSADVAITVVPDPTEGSTGATPVPPGYPTNPNVFELIAHKGAASGYPSLDATGKVPASQLPAATAGGDMLKSVYDTDGNGVVDTCDSIISSRVLGLGTASSKNAPNTGVNASTAQVVMGDDTRLTDTRAPIAHQATHNGGSDPIPLASSSAQGLCPPVDGVTVQVVSGKLTATTSGNGDMLKSVYDTNNDGIVDNAAALQTHIVPPAGNASATQVVLGNDTRLSDQRTPTIHQSTHVVGGSDPIPLATTSVAGLCPSPDATTITISAGKLAAILATTSAPGIVKPDGTTITIAGGTISAAASVIGNHGARYRLTSNFSLTAGVNIVSWASSTAEYDTDTYWASGNPTRLTIPSAQAGTYTIGTAMAFTGGSGGTYVEMLIKFNGTLSAYLAGTTGTNKAAMDYNISTVYKFVANDYIEIEVDTDISSMSAFAGSRRSAFWVQRIA